MKLSDADVALIREQAAEGRSARDLAAEFDVSRRHIARIVRGDTRPQIGGLDADTIAAGSVRDAVDHFLADLELDDADRILAAAAGALAEQLDRCRRSDTAAAASATPQIAHRLIEVIGELRGSHREPDGIDLLIRKREARLLAQAAAR